ncbi:TPA: dihydroxyacetone kinase transcriptional activator DhaS [Streptococcus agalactiae]
MASSLITKKKIAKSFKRLFISQAFDKISVSDIMEDAGIRRQTFYNHFVDKYALLEWIFQTELSEQVTDNLDYISGFQLLSELLTFFKMNQEFYIKLFQIEDQNDFSSYFESYCEQLVDKLLSDYSKSNFSQKERVTFINYHSKALSYFIKYELLNNSKEELFNRKVIEKIIRTSIENY